MNNADGIEAAYCKFLDDSKNKDAVQINAMIQNRITPDEFVKNCRNAYSKLLQVIHAATLAYRNLHANEMFVDALLHIPRLKDNEKYTVEILSEFL